MKILDQSREDEYKEFLEKHHRCNFQQSLEWKNVKENWENKIIISEDEKGQIAGSISVLTRKIPIFGNIMYVPRGPMCNIHDKEVLTDLSNRIKKSS